MYKSPFLFALTVLVFHVSAIASDPSLALLPTSNSVPARVMQLGMPKEALKIAEKLKTALLSQPEWAKTYITENDANKPLPYHPNLQVTEEEYRAFLTTKYTLTQVGTVSLARERQQDGSILLRTNPPTSKVNGITIEPEGKTVTTALATLLERSTVDNQSPESATGRWIGTQWQYQSVSDARIIMVKFALGKRTDHGDGIIFYDVKDVQGEQRDIYSEILLFPLAN